jgi:UDP-N-acetylmuramoyl-L-alanyl-D-glutamate--2,6-diaminopimelate ligase
MNLSSPTRPSLGALLPACPPHLADVVPTDMTLDSRELSSGELFVAVPGRAADGRQFIDDVLSRGASAVLAEAGGMVHLDKRVISYQGLTTDLPQIVQRFYERPSASLSVVAVTGTNGKTSVVDFVCQLLRLLGHKAGSIGTLGARTDSVVLETTNTTPDIISINRQLAHWVDANVHYVALEASSHALDQGRLQGLCINTAVFTNLSRDHLDYHGSEDDYAAAKLRLFTQFDLQRAIYNADDAVAKRIGDLLPERSLAVSTKDKEADVFIEIVGNQPTSFKLVNPYGVAHISSQLSGDFNAFNLAVAITVVQGLGLPAAQVFEAAQEVTAVAGRLESVGSPSGPHVFLDYAHTPDALERTLSALRPELKGRLLVVFGCGGDRDRGKRPQMGAIANRLADGVIVTSDNPRSEDPEVIIDEVMAGVGQSGVRISDRAKGIVCALEMASPDDTVLVAGKGHEQYQEIAGRRIPFCDREVIETWFKHRESAQ